MKKYNAFTICFMVTVVIDVLVFRLPFESVVANIVYDTVMSGFDSNNFDDLPSMIPSNYTMINRGPLKWLSSYHRTDCHVLLLGLCQHQ